jgi:hypothetical protein
VTENLPQFWDYIFRKIDFALRTKLYHQTDFKIYNTKMGVKTRSGAKGPNTRSKKSFLIPEKAERKKPANKNRVHKKAEQKKLVKKNQKEPKRTRVPRSDSFDYNKYGRDIYTGKKNVYHGWVGDPWQRDFNGLEKPSTLELEEESEEDRAISREMKKYQTHFTGYAIDGFIAETDDESEGEDDEFECDESEEDESEEEW